MDGLALMYYRCGVGEVNERLKSSVAR